MIRIGFCGILYYNHNKDPQSSIGNYYGPHIAQQVRNTPQLIIRGPVQLMLSQRSVWLAGR